MDIERTATELSERKVVRRGLITGLAALAAAAAMKVTGAEKAQAANGEMLIIGNFATVGPQTATAGTWLEANTSVVGLYVVGGATSPSVAIQGDTKGSGKIGIAGYGHSGAKGIVGENLENGNAAPGVEGVSHGFGSIGVRGTSNGTGVLGVSNATNINLDGDGAGPGVWGKSGNGDGVRGESLSGTGVRGAATGNGAGLKGFSNIANIDAAGDGSGPGVWGKSGNGDGVRGESASGVGVRGAATSNGTGLKGYSNVSNINADGDGSGIGVWGKSRTGAAVYGEAASGVGSVGISTNFMGVVGRSSNSHGVYGSTAAPGNTITAPEIVAGVTGQGFSQIGVQGISDSQPGVQGVSASSLGVRGISTNFVGVVGISTNSHGLYGSTHVGANGYGIVAENLGANGPGLFVNGTAPSQVFGGLQVFGPKNAVLKMQDGTFASVYCQESPEPYFEDFGRAQLVGGIANVPLEREFATLVAGGDYHVFTEAEGETRGLFVSRRTPGGFEVREIGGGSGSVPFSYRIVTRRKDIEGKRFARVSTEAAEKVVGVRAVLAAMVTPGSVSGHSSGPSLPLPPQPAIPPTGNTTPHLVPGGPGSTIVPPGAGPSSTSPNAGR